MGKSDKIAAIMSLFLAILVRNCLFLDHIFNLKVQKYGYLFIKCCYHQAIEGDKTKTIMSLLFCLNL